MPACFPGCGRAVLYGSDTGHQVARRGPGDGPDVAGHVLLVEVAGGNGQLSQAQRAASGPGEAQGALQAEDPGQYCRAIPERRRAAAVDLALADAANLAPRQFRD